MNCAGRAFDRLAAVEPSFQPDGPWRGRFELDGQRVHCGLDQSDWLYVSAPLAGSDTDLLGRQQHVLLPLKVIAGPALVAELPVVEDLVSSFSALRDVLRQGLARVIAGADSLADDGVNADGLARLQTVLDESTFTWEREEDHLSTRAGLTKVVARSAAASAVFRAKLVRLPTPPRPSLDALADFALALNARFRFVRATFLADRMVAEVAVPWDALTPMVVNRAAAAIGGCARRTKGACAALADPLVAERYLEFHSHRKDAYADTQH